MRNNAFREDINGLRALAVVSVVLYHYSANWLPGGFAGVDVFFVVSGYLMTSIIFRGLENGNFSMLAFVRARAARIIPALLVIVTLTLLVGYAFLEPMSYQGLAKHGYSSLIFLSNIVYANEAGYFNQQSLSNILLHTWSLSVEWQFYIAYPILVGLLSRVFSYNKLKLLVCGLAICSFLVGLAMSYFKPTAAYFMFYSRSWEMLVGGLAYLYPIHIREQLKNKYEVVGVALIVVSFVFVTQDSVWPGYMALLPVFGTYLCLVSNNQKTILNGTLVSKLGLWSYSIYLVHWPLLSFTYKLGGEIDFYLYVFITLLFSFVLYEFVERNRRFNLKIAGLFLMVCAMAVAITKTGASYRVNEQFRLDSRQYHQQYYGGSGFRADSSVIYINPEQEPELIVTGDSYARQYARYISTNEVSAIGIFRDWCFSSGNYWNGRDAENDRICNRRYENFVLKMSEYPEVDVFLAQNWIGYNLLTSREDGKVYENYNKQLILEQLDEIIKLGGDQRNYFIIGVPGGVKQVAYECLSRASLLGSKLFPRSCGAPQKQELIQVNEILKYWSKQHRNVFFIDPNEFLCERAECITLTEQRLPIYSDRTHLSVYGAEIVAPEILKIIKNARAIKNTN